MNPLTSLAGNLASGDALDSNSHCQMVMSRGTSGTLDVNWVLKTHNEIERQTISKSNHEHEVEISRRKHVGADLELTINVGLLASENHFREKQVRFLAWFHSK